MFGNANQSFNLFSDDRALTCKASGAIPGSRFVKLVAGGTFQQPVVALCGAGEQAYGVSGWDAVDGDTLTVQKLGCWTVKAGANLTAPQQIQSDAAGKAVALTTGKRLGQIHADAVLDADAAVELKL
jgi:hypothetical protein